MKLNQESWHETTPVNLPSLIVDMTVSVESGLFFIGAWQDPENQVASFGVLDSGNPDNLIALFPAHPTRRLCKTLRRHAPDNDALNGIAMEGFVAFMPLRVKDHVQLAMHLHDGSSETITQLVIDNNAINTEDLDRIWPHSGALFLHLAEQVLPPDHGLTQRLREQAARTNLSPPTMFIDKALQVESALFCFYGWSPHGEASISRLWLFTTVERIDLTSRIHRLQRTDLAAIFPNLGDALHGFFFLLVQPPEAMRDASLLLETVHGETASLPLLTHSASWTEGESLLRSLWSQTFDDLPVLLEQSRALRLTRLTERLIRLQARLMTSYHGTLSVNTHEVMSHGFFALDRAWALGAGGLLLMGWRFDPCHRVQTIHLHALCGLSVNITDRLFAVPRPDVVEAYRSRFPEIPPDTGFICLIPLPTAPGDMRFIQLRRASGGSRWLRLPDTRQALSGLALVHDIFNHVFNPGRMRHRLHALFDQHLGPAITAIAAAPPPPPERIETVVFGTPPSAPKVSVLVPLYGRYDFLRHQLAQFADDPDFQTVDLLYLVDDPRILNDTLELAAAVGYPLFGLPFRVVHAGANLGYAAINNLGARLARAETLLLLNSDVIPLHPGWLGILLAALERLPEAGAVAPLLLFPEGGIQHAGMVVRERPRFPGFLFNQHPGKGHLWNGPDTPLEQAMLSAACLLLRTADYLDGGGLDEGYRVGDYEDSDLCLRLRQRGQRLYLEPGAKLCHLERQSQGLAEWGERRLLLSLYNAWRFGEKIRSGQLPAPIDPASTHACAS